MTTISMVFWRSMQVLSTYIVPSSILLCSAWETAKKGQSASCTAEVQKCRMQCISATCNLHLSRNVAATKNSTDDAAAFFQPTRLLRTTQHFNTRRQQYRIECTQCEKVLCCLRRSDFPLLHVAIYNCSVDVIRYLIEQWPKGLAELAKD